MDSRIKKILEHEEQLEARTIHLIPSDNYASSAVRECLRSPIQNRYAEGYPGKRYYGGQQYTDEIEELTRQLARDIYGGEYANVQPLSGSPANLAICSAILEPGDHVVSLSLDHGGHLTHGHPKTLGGRLYTFHHYGMDADTGHLDYDTMESLIAEHKPKLVIVGGSALGRVSDFARVAAAATSVGAYSMADVSHESGMIAGGAYPRPLDHGIDVMMSTTHKSLRGPRGALIVVRNDEELSKKINSCVFPGLQGGPHMNAVAGKAQAMIESQTPAFKEYTAQILRNAHAMAEKFKSLGVQIIGNGTDTHLMMVDVNTSFDIHGRNAQEVLESVGIICNKNMIPDDPRTPGRPSGIRLGTPAITTRGLCESECERIAEMITEVLRNHKDDVVLKTISDEVREMMSQFSIPQ